MNKKHNEAQECEPRFEPYDELKLAIIKQAAMDYKIAWCKLATHKMCRDKYIDCLRKFNECERFFSGENFDMYSSADGDYILQQLKNELADEYGEIKTRNYTYGSEVK